MRSREKIEEIDKIITELKGLNQEIEDGLIKQKKGLEELRGYL